jgi:hypothetical protein
MVFLMDAGEFREGVLPTSFPLSSWSLHGYLYLVCGLSVGDPRVSPYQQHRKSGPSALLPPYPDIADCIEIIGKKNNMKR